MTVINLVPRLRPAIDGVGDYAFRLASYLDKEFAVTTQFIVADPTWRRNEETKGWSIAALPTRTAKALAPTLDGVTTVILHYVPHGYAKKACPFWLIRGLERWLAQTPNARLITMFHELYALDWHRPWSSDFYLSPVQQHLATRVAQMSDAVLTSTERYRSLIQRLSRGKHSDIPTLPVFSNMGEPLHYLPLAKRQRCLIIFGQCRTKSLIYRQSHPLLEQICQTLDIQEIWDIGPSTGLAPSHIGAIALTELGQKSDAEISQILSQAIAGFLHYDPQCLGKSSIFAAYCAQGLLPINQTAASLSVDGLIPGTHYWVPGISSTHSSTTDNLIALQTIADHAHSWYQTHSLSAQASIFLKYLAISAQSGNSCCP